METVGRIATTLAGDVPIPLRRLDSNGTIVARTLAPGTAAQIVRILGRLTVQVSDLIPPAGWNAVAQHCYGHHRRACRTATCTVARAMVPLPLGEVSAVSA